MHFVYILYSPAYDRYYIGQTSDLDARLLRHQKGYIKSTKNHLPIHLVWNKQVASRSEAVKLESHIKSWKSKIKIKELVDASR